MNPLPVKFNAQGYCLRADLARMTLTQRDLDTNRLTSPSNAARRTRRRRND
jgi:hypothetical protein